MKRSRVTLLGTCALIIGYVLHLPTHRGDSVSSNHIEKVAGLKASDSGILESPTSPTKQTFRRGQGDRERKDRRARHNARQSSRVRYLRLLGEYPAAAGRSCHPCRLLPPAATR